MGCMCIGFQIGRPSALKAAMASPSAMNERPWQFYVVRNKEVLQKMSEVTPYSGLVATAPVAIAITYKEDRKLPQFRQIDCALATENIWLAIDNQGLGGVMIGVAPDVDKMNKLAECLNLGEDEKAFTMIPFGYPLVEKEQPERYEESKVHFID